MENRTWRTLYRGALIIHASSRADDVTTEEIARRFGVRLNDDLPLGGIVGIVELKDCVRDHPSRWAAPDCFHFSFANARPVKFTPWRGALVLRDAPSELLERLALNDASGIEPSNGRELDAA